MYSLHELPNKTLPLAHTEISLHPLTHPLFHFLSFGLSLSSRCMLASIDSLPCLLSFKILSDFDNDNDYTIITGVIPVH